MSCTEDTVAHNRSVMLSFSVCGNYVIGYKLDQGADNDSLGEDGDMEEGALSPMILTGYRHGRSGHREQSNLFLMFWRFDVMRQKLALLWKTPFFGSRVCSEDYIPNCLLLLLSASQDFKKEEAWNSIQEDDLQHQQHYHDGVAEDTSHSGLIMSQVEERRRQIESVDHHYSAHFGSAGISDLFVNVSQHIVDRRVLGMWIAFLLHRSPYYAIEYTSLNISHLHHQPP